MGRAESRNQHANYKNKCQNVHETVCTVLAYLTEQNRDLVLPPALLSCYSTFATPWMYEWATVTEYIHRLKEWIVCGPESFLAAVCLMRRLEALGVVPPCTQRSIHRTYFVCLVLAVKYLEDETLSNSDFAKVGCVSVQELNEMEQHACLALRFNCTVTLDEFELCQKELAAVEEQIVNKTITLPKGDFVSLADFLGDCVTSSASKRSSPNRRNSRKRFSLTSLRLSAKKTASLMLPHKSTSPPSVVEVVEEATKHACKGMGKSAPTITDSPVAHPQVTKLKHGRSKSVAAISRRRTSEASLKKNSTGSTGQNEKIRTLMKRSRSRSVTRQQPVAPARTAKATPIFFLRQDSL